MAREPPLSSPRPTFNTSNGAAQMAPLLPPTARSAPQVQLPNAPEPSEPADALEWQLSEVSARPMAATFNNPPVPRLALSPLPTSPYQASMPALVAEQVPAAGGGAAAAAGREVAPPPASAILGAGAPPPPPASAILGASGRGVIVPLRLAPLAPGAGLAAALPAPPPRPSTYMMSLPQRKKAPLPLPAAINDDEW